MKEDVKTSRGENGKMEEDVFGLVRRVIFHWGSPDFCFSFRTSPRTT
jgi:hypothetical protein